MTLPRRTREPTGVLAALVRASAPRPPGGESLDALPLLERLQVLLEALSPPLRALLPLALLVLDVSPLFTGQGFRRFRSLPPREAELCLDAWEHSRIRACRNLVRLLMGLVALASWDTPALQEAIGYRVEEHIRTVNAPSPP